MNYATAVLYTDQNRTLTKVTVSSVDFTSVVTDLSTYVLLECLLNTIIVEM